MPAEASSDGKPDPRAKPTQAEREAAALRENLRRRKQQARARQAQAGETAPDPADDGKT